MNIKTSWLSFTSLNIPTQWQMTKAKRSYVKEHSECAICGYKKRLEVHHVVPVHVDPLLSCDKDNFITLCRTCHFSFGHFHNFREYWNPSIKDFAKFVNKRYNTYYLQLHNILINE